MKNLTFMRSLLFFAVAAAIQGQTINMVTTMGAFPDGTNAAANTRAFQTAFANFPNAKIVVPPGNYAIDNSQGAITIQNFNGELEFQGQAVLLFQTNTKGGLRFLNGNGMRIIGMHGNYPQAPTQRVATQFSFTGSNDVFVRNIVAENSPGAAIMFTLCRRTKVINATVTKALADGVIFANSLDSQITNLTTSMTSDNGLAFYNYANLEDLDGGTASNIHVTRSNAHGIAVAGTSNVVVSGFVVDTTSGSAVFVGKDHVYSTRIPDNVTIQHGYVKNSGTLQPTTGNPFGIEYNLPVSALFSDIQIDGSAGRSVSGIGQSTRVYLRNIRTKNNVVNDDFMFFQTQYVDISDCVSENSSGTGFFFDQIGTAIARRLKAINSAQNSSLHRAMWFGDGSYVSAADLLVVDTQSTPTGYVVGASNASGFTEKGSIQGIASAIPNGKLIVRAYAAGVHITDAN